MPPANICIAAIGSLGDILPFLALGEGLVRAAESVTVLSNDNHSVVIERCGLRFECVAPTAPSHETYDSRAVFSDYFMPAFTRMYDIVSKRARVTRNTLVIAHDVAFGALFAAEANGLPCVRVVLSPAGLQAAGTSEETQMLTDINCLRKGLHLQPLKSLAALTFVDVPLALGLFSRLFAAPLRNLPGNMRLVGFPLHRRRLFPLDQAASDFIDREGRPIVFTPGTGVRAVGNFFDIAARASRAAGLPAIFLSSHVEPGRYASDTRILVRKYIDLECVLPLSVLAVHHGGIGTIARCIRASIPQIVCPRLFDQPDNARRVVAFGLGEAIRPEGFTSEALVSAARRLLRDDEVRNRIASLSNALLEPDGLRAAIEAIVETFELDGAVCSTA